MILLLAEAAAAVQLRGAPKPKGARYFAEKEPLTSSKGAFVPSSSPQHKKGAVLSHKKLTTDVMKVLKPSWRKTQKSMTENLKNSKKVYKKEFSAVFAKTSGLATKLKSWKPMLETNKTETEAIVAQVTKGLTTKLWGERLSEALKKSEKKKEEQPGDDVTIPAVTESGDGRPALATVAEVAQIGEDYVGCTALYEEGKEEEASLCSCVVMDIVTECYPTLEGCYYGGVWPPGGQMMDAIGFCVNQPSMAACVTTNGPSAMEDCAGQKVDPTPEGGKGKKIPTPEQTTEMVEMSMGCAEVDQNSDEAQACHCAAHEIVTECYETFFDCLSKDGATIDTCIYGDHYAECMEEKKEEDECAVGPVALCVQKKESEIMTTCVANEEVQDDADCVDKAHEEGMSLEESHHFCNCIVKDVAHSCMDAMEACEEHHHPDGDMSEDPGASPLKCAQDDGAVETCAESLAQNEQAMEEMGDHCYEEAMRKDEHYDDKYDGDDVMGDWGEAEHSQDEPDDWGEDDATDGDGDFDDDDGEEKDDGGEDAGPKDDGGEEKADEGKEDEKPEEE